MNAAGFIPLHYAVSQVVRLLRLRFRIKARVRQGMRSAILNGDLKAYWIDETAYGDDVRVYLGEAAAQIPALEFENPDAAENALSWSRLPIDPTSIVRPEYCELQCVVHRGELRAWLQSISIEAFASPTPARAHDSGHRLPQTQYRTPQKHPYISMTGALSWARNRITLIGQEFVDADMFEHDVDARDRKYAEILIELLDAAMNEELELIGRRRNADGEVSADFETLAAHDLANYQRFDPSDEALGRGRGIAWTISDEFCESDLLKQDGFENVQVKRQSLFKLYKPDPEPSSAAAQGLAEIRIARALEADPNCEHTRDYFINDARAAIKGLSERAAFRAWGAVAPPIRKEGGRPKARSRRG